MACPFFDPLEPRGRASDPRFAMLPLGDSWAGQCLANPLSVVTPDDWSAHHLCNLGYARAACPRFLAGDDLPDAVRFALASDEPPEIRLRWAIERDHRPFAHGTLEFDRATGEYVCRDATPAADAVLRLARAYVRSYLRRTELLSRA
jgi:hypothetical protein